MDEIQAIQEQAPQEHIEDKPKRKRGRPKKAIGLKGSIYTQNLIMR